MTAKRTATLWVVAILLVSACGGGDDEDSPQNYACRYEKRFGNCNQASPTGAYTAGCFQFDANNYNISPSQVCTNVTTNATTCAAGCCVVTQFQKVSLSSGTC